MQLRFRIWRILVNFTDFWLNLAKFADFYQFDNSLCLFPFFIVFPVIFTIAVRIDICKA